MDANASHGIGIGAGRWHWATAFAAATMCAGLAGSAVAQSAPDTENGRYTLSPVAEGFLRLDTRTGAVSTCTSKGGWVCRVVPDERAALDIEIGRLQNENLKLKEQLAQREPPVGGKIDAPLAKEDSLKKSAPADKAERPKIELELPDDHDKLMAWIERVWSQLIDMANRMQKKLSEKI
ncbi:hypothetical protein ASC80_14195 [Afipia sp. Root123D2]|nr:hypothetical protein ASC80_14195 [Afipia sp. Root123D2]